MPSLRSILVVTVLLSMSSAARAHDAVGRHRFAEIPGVREWAGRLIVQVRSREQFVERNGGDAKAARERAQRARARLQEVVRSDAGRRRFVIRVPASQPAIELARALLATDDYEYVEPDWRLFAVALPSDPLFAEQWHLPHLGAAAAWDISTGDPEVVIAVVDSGIDLDHPDLAAQLVPGFNAVDQLAQVDGGDVDGLTDHGTRVAGVAGAVGDNGIGVVGVAWNVSLMPIRARNVPDDTAFVSDLLSGAEWAAEHGADIVNVSFSGVQSEAVVQTGDSLRSLGVHLVWAAGNAGQSLSAFDPDSVLIVGATDQDDDLAGFSNFGPAVDLVAPGVEIYTTELDGEFGFIDGTSFSAPLVCGALALVKSVVPDLSVSAVETLLFFTAVDLGEPAEDDVFGAGRLDLEAALSLALSTTTDPLAPLALADSAVVFDGSPVTIEVLSNDVDLNGDAIGLAGFDPVSAAGGLIAQRGDALVYSPAPGFEGVDEFSYQIEDATGLFAGGSVTVTVAHVPPFAPASSFALPVGHLASKLQITDLDADGAPDVVVSSRFLLDGLLEIFLNDGSGSLIYHGSVAVGTDPTALAVADFDLDGHVDIANVNNGDGTITVSLGDGAGGVAAPLELPAGNDPWGLVASDLDADGHVDLATALFVPSNAVSLWRGVGGGAFVFDGTHDVAIGPVGVHAGDLDGDGWSDLITHTLGVGVVSVLPSDGSGGFQPHVDTGVLSGAIDLAQVDFEGDGDIDLVTCHGGFLGTPRGLGFMANDGAGNLTESEAIALSGTPTSIAASDLEGDGDPDFIVGNVTGNRVHLLITEGGGGVVNGPFLDTQFGVFDVALADMSGDGRQDVVALVASGEILIFESLLPPAPTFVRGDVDSNRTVDLGDAVSSLQYLFSGGAIACRDAADTDDDGVIDLADTVRLLSYLFVGGPPPAVPFPDPGPDESADGLDCVQPDSG